MFVRALVVTGFRNLEGCIPLCEPLAVLLGENNSGKSSVIDALRLLFTPETGPRGRKWITEQDFRHDPAGVRTTDVLELEAQLTGLTSPEQARMVTCLAPSLGAGCARLRLRATRRATGRVDVEWFGGDSQHAEVEAWAREAVVFTYLPALRDAAADLRPGRDNRLVGLLAALAPVGHDDRVEIERITAEANVALSQVGAVVEARTSIQRRLGGMTGSGGFTQQTDLAFADPRFDRIVATLRALAGPSVPLELAENGLGYNNLIYIAVVLAALADNRDAALRLLLVEEPEAHLHPQLQDLLMRYLESESGNGTQVVLSSHSPNLASAARVERVTVMIAGTEDSPSSARAPREFGLGPRELGHLRRFLDATKSSLLFARGVILVEGVAEQLLLPVLADRLGRPLPRHGVAVINVGGVAFAPFIGLFGPDRLPCRCAVLSDADPPAAGPDIAEDPPDRSARASALLGIQSDTLQVRLARRTLEWDLAAAGNWKVLVTALLPIKPRVTARLATELPPLGDEERADRILVAISDVKGRFAQELAAIIEIPNIEFHVPPYIREAVEWVTP